MRRRANAVREPRAHTSSATDVRARTRPAWTKRTAGLAHTVTVRAGRLPNVRHASALRARGSTERTDRLIGPIMPPNPQSLTWRGKHAVLLVHGVGNAQPGAYAELAREIEAILGDRAATTAVYTFYYDQINTWFAEKHRAKLLFAKLTGALRALLAGTSIDKSIDPVQLGNAIADFAGDVIWPILIADARHAVRLALIAQLRQMVLDGERVGVRPPDQHLTIIAHSLGCFHVYEALHTAAIDESHGLAPATYGVQFANVILMASPVQLIRSVARRMGDAVPQQHTLHCVSQGQLAMPVQSILGGRNVPSVHHTVSITGDLDPVGGHFFRSSPAWAYMALPGQTALVVTQQLATAPGDDELELRELLMRSLREGSAPEIKPNNPHSWAGYVKAHAAQLRSWLV